MPAGIPVAISDNVAANARAIGERTITGTWPVGGGIPFGMRRFALIFTVCIAAPASMLLRSRHVANERDDRFWKIVREQNAAKRRASER